MLHVSVVMPAYNAEKYIRKSIESVLNQTYKDFELIIIDDCSTDKTLDIINDIKSTDERIKLYRNERNCGVSFSRNLGIDSAKGDWIAFCDADDLWCDDKLKKQIGVVCADKSTGLCFTGSRFTDTCDNEYSWVLQVPKSVCYKELLKRNIISCSSVLVKKSTISSVRFCSDKFHEDYVAWLRILKNDEKAVGINEPLLIYRISNTSKSGRRLKSAGMTYKSYRSVDYNPIVSLFMTFRYAKYSITKRIYVRRSCVCRLKESN